MDATEFIVTDVADFATPCDVYRESDSGAYSGSKSKVDAKDVYVFAPNSTQQTVTEGSGQDTSFTGLAVVDTDVNGDVVHHVEVGDELRVQSDDTKRYDVRVKEGVPDDIEPVVWRFGLDRANSAN